MAPGAGRLASGVLGPDGLEMHEAPARCGPLAPCPGAQMPLRAPFSSFLVAPGTVEIGSKPTRLGGPGAGAADTLPTNLGQPWEVSQTLARNDIAHVSLVISSY